MQFLTDLFSYRRALIAVSAIILLFTLFRLHTTTNLLSSQPSIIVGHDSGAIPRLGTVDTSTPSYISKANRPTLDIVVSMYRENLTQMSTLFSELRSLPPFQYLEINAHIYTKDEKADVKLIKDKLDTPFVTILKNAGREGGTYLAHITKNWDRLARHTLFIQAEPHELEWAKGRILDYFGPSTGLLSLGVMEACDCVSCRDPWDAARTFPRLEELYSAINGEFCPKKIALSYLGQMIVSATRIRSRGLDTYLYLKEVLESGPSHFIHDDPRQGSFKDDVTDPYFGHTIERSYMVLWSCENTKITERCGGWNGLRRRRGLLDGDDFCQCLDPVHVS